MVSDWRSAASAGLLVLAAIAGAYGAPLEVLTGLLVVAGGFMISWRHRHD